jgi:hypothetical protein
LFQWGAFYEVHGVNHEEKYLSVFLPSCLNRFNIGYCRGAEEERFRACARAQGERTGKSGSASTAQHTSAAQRSSAEPYSHS